MTRPTLIIAIPALACAAPALAQTSNPPRNDLPQPYRTTRDWGELPPGMKWAAVTSIEAPADDTIYVTDSESGPDAGANELMGIRKGIRIGSARDGGVFAFIEDMESTTPDHLGAEGVGVDAQGNVYGAVVRRQMLERHAKK